NERTKEVTYNVLHDLLKKILIVLFPFVPFITEEIYSYLPEHRVSIYTEDYPTCTGYKMDKSAIDLTNSLNDAIKAIRNHKSENGLAPNAPINLSVYASKDVFDMIEPYIRRFSFAKEVTLITEKNDDLLHFKSFALSITDFETADSKLQKQKHIEYLKQEIARSEKMLSNPNFLAKANPDKVTLEKEKYQSYLDELKKYSD
ncbi:MAG: class I tRNA ligase family protein, partial [Bacilli bacterium]